MCNWGFLSACVGDFQGDLPLSPVALEQARRRTDGRLSQIGAKLASVVLHASQLAKWELLMLGLNGFVISGLTSVDLSGTALHRRVR